MALGVPPRALALRPLLMGAQIALLGTALGIAIGVGFAGWPTGVFEDQLPLPAGRLPDGGVPGRRGARFLLPLAATAYPVWRGVRVAPIEAIRVGFRAAKGGGFAPLLKRVELPSSLVQMPLRNLARAPRRTLTTILGLAAVIVTVVSLSGMFDCSAARSIVSRRRRCARAPRGSTCSWTDFTGGTTAPWPIERSRAVGAEAGIQVQGELRTPGRRRRCRVHRCRKPHLDAYPRRRLVSSRQRGDRDRPEGGPRPGTGSG